MTVEMLHGTGESIRGSGLSGFGVRIPEKVARS